MLLALLNLAHADLNVVATLPDLAAVSQAVGGDHVKVTSMALPTQDPHFVDAKPNLAVKLSKADALVHVGLEMEIGWLPTLVTGSRNKDVQSGATGNIDCSQYVTVLDKPAGAVDRAMGDVHGQGNPHYFYDPRRMKDVALGLADRFGQLDPEFAEVYTANAQAFAADIDAHLPEWERRLAGYQGAPVIGYHRSWSYLADWTGFSVVGAVEPKPGIPPTPGHIAKTVNGAKETGVQLVLIESFYPATSASLVADKAEATLLTLTAGTDFPRQTYVAHIDAWVDSMEGAL
ncbi:MAG: zinc ABC transporter solute-binding protein [Proteobacteria bacterium]|nr:zinc ABC transporter solute-binding protein [Pseudomonadota bacterium]MCP4922181.1 zinc ABC transporter solute-binding protein [Pseudomonadota bacterium]